MHTSMRRMRPASSWQTLPRLRRLRIRGTVCDLLRQIFFFMSSRSNFFYIAKPSLYDSVLQRNLRRDKDRRTLTQFNMQTLPKSAKQKERCVLLNQRKAYVRRLKIQSMHSHPPLFFEQGPYAPAKEVPEAIWCTAEVGSKVAGMKCTSFHLSL